MILTIVFVIIIFSILVIVHELGHFFVAKRNKIAVEEFGIGFPPAILKRKFRKTLFSINLFPIGGFVKIKGENVDEEQKKPDRDSFLSKTTWVKIKVLLAGVTMNLVLSYIIILFLCVTGLPSIMNNFSVSFLKSMPVGKSGMTIFYVTNNSPAQKANLHIGDKIISIDELSISSNTELSSFTEKNAGKEVTIKYVSPYDSRDKFTKAVLSERNVDNNGYLGVASLHQQNFRYRLWQAPFAAIFIVSKMIWATLSGLYNLVIGLIFSHKVSEGVAGPVGITLMLSQVQKLGLSYLLVIVSAISISLAVINSLPIPALDGGRVFLILIKKAGIKVSPKIEQSLHVIGFLLLIILMVIITIRDVLKLKI